jgi:predicted nucleic acid-binding protein
LDGAPADGRRHARLARALGDCRCDPLGDELARRAGELCGRAGTSDIVDAVVVESARRRGDDVYTSDTDDLGRLAGHVSRPVAIVPIDADSVAATSPGAAATEG